MIGRTQSHGRVRMTNWDVRRLLEWAKTATPAVFELRRFDRARPKLCNRVPGNHVSAKNTIGMDDRRNVDLALACAVNRPRLLSSQSTLHPLTTRQSHAPWSGLANKEKPYQRCSTGQRRTRRRFQMLRERHLKHACRCGIRGLTARHLHRRTRRLTRARGALAHHRAASYASSGGSNIAGFRSCSRASQAG